MREIVFGNWKLIPADNLNWELAHYHESTRGKNKGVATWHRQGMYYQQATVANALRYAADYEMKHGNGDLGLDEAIREYESITNRMVAEIREVLGCATN